MNRGNRVAIFIDGGYLNKRLELEFSKAAIDYHRFSRLMAGEREILRTYYYDCLPYLSHSPTQTDQKRYDDKAKFFEHLNHLPSYEVRLGDLVKRYGRKGKKGKKEQGPYFEQKQIDMLMGIDLVLLATRHVITDACLVTGDSDFVPAIVAAKAEGVKIHLFHGHPDSVHRELIRVVDERTRITAAMIESILMPMKIEEQAS